MVAAAPTLRRDRIAIAASIALHCCVLAVWAALPRPSFPADDPDERSLLASVIRIEHRPPAPAPHSLSPMHRAEVVAASAPVPPIHVATSRAHAARKLVVASERRAAPLVEPDRRAIVTPTVIAPAAVARPTAAAVAAAPVTSATGVPAASPAPATASTAAPREDGIGNFGETYPAAIDPSARGALLAGIAGVVVRITVDENGRATAIDFVREPSDAAQRDELRARLLAARFIPAACNGLRCAGTVTLRS
ncbi:MAG TPA: hypothetical protein VHT53_01845 [Candidatus Elarobacter sp.]|nr:hypothetical protein [Candidatus Elarobacter sp.]